MLIIAFISANNTGFLSKSTIETVEISAVVLVIIFALLLFKQKKPESKTTDSAHNTLFRNLFSKVYLASNLLIVLIVISPLISLGAFIYESTGNDRHIKYIPATSATEKNVNVILIVIDTLRADHLSCYGYERATTPYIDAFAKESVLFKNCYPQASWTKPSMASILTSLYPSMHGTTSPGSALPDKAKTIAEVFKENGYLTYGYVANPHLKKMFSFDQGFDFYDDLLMQDKLYYAALRCFRSRFGFAGTMTGKRFDFSDRDNIKLANKRILPWLKEYKNNNFFMYLHYMDPHHPYSPPSPYDSMYPYVKDDQYSSEMALYDGEIRFVDENLNHLFTKLRDWGIYDNTMIVITSDHGEAFGEHNNERHGYTVYNELIKVPLIVKYPGNLHAGKTIEKQVRSIDIFPTLLEAMEINDNNSLEGGSVTSMLEHAESNLCQYIYVDNNWCDIYVHESVIKNNHWKYIYTEKSELRDIEKLGHEELYNLQNDPMELRNIIDENAEMARSLRKELGYYRERCSKRQMKASKVELDLNTIRNLKALGYLQ